MAPPARERRQFSRWGPSDRRRGPPGREAAYRRPGRSAGTAWNADLWPVSRWGPASRGSAKPALMTPRHTNMSAARSFNPGWRDRLPLTAPGGPLRLCHARRGVQRDAIIVVSPAGCRHCGRGGRRNPHRDSAVRRNPVGRDTLIAWSEVGRGRPEFRRAAPADRLWRQHRDPARIPRRHVLPDLY